MDNPWSEIGIVKAGLSIFIYAAVSLILIIGYISLSYASVGDFPVCKCEDTPPQTQDLYTPSDENTNIMEKLKHPPFYALDLVYDRYFCSGSGRRFPPSKRIAKFLKGSNVGCVAHAPPVLDISKLKTGDLLAISYHGARAMFSTSTYRSIWTHVGLVVVDEKTSEPYIMEIAKYKAPYSHHVVMIPFLTWARINRNTRTVAWLQINKSPSVESLMNTFSEFADSGVCVEGLSSTWFRFLDIKKPETVDKDSFFATEKNDPGIRFFSSSDKCKNLAYKYSLTCHEMIIYILQNAGVYSTENTACSYLPSCIVNRRIQMTNGFCYLDPIQACLYDHANPDLKELY